jgi:molecular chaperone GrpE
MTAGIDRDEILRRFEALLDSALTAEVPPGGIDAEILSSVMAASAGENRQCDSYALWAALTALTQEIKLQGRAFQELNRTLIGQPDKIAEELRALYAERERTVQRDAERRSRKEGLSALIDLRDRLSRGLDSARSRHDEAIAASRAGWWSRMIRRDRAEKFDAIDALIRGYELGVERLDQALDESNACEIRCLGEPFDPHRMNAVESEESDTVPRGTVLEVYRSGYEWNGEVFRPAQVKVSRGGKLLRNRDRES